MRQRVGDFIETVLEEELQAALGRGRYERLGEGARGHRHGHRTRQVIGTFGATVKVPRARMIDDAGKASEWCSQGLRRYQRLTKKAEALIAAVYLADQRAAGQAGAVRPVRWCDRKDVVSRAWRKVKTDWEAWCARGLAEEDIVRLILDGTVVKARIDRKATAISVLAAIGVRRDGQKVLLAIRNMGGESTAGVAGVPRRPRRPRPEGAGLRHRRRRSGPRGGADRAVRRMRRSSAARFTSANLLAHAPKSLHDSGSPTTAT